jgi:hypothetical protein
MVNFRRFCRSLPISAVFRRRLCRRGSDQRQRSLTILLRQPLWPGSATAARIRNAERDSRLKRDGVGASTRRNGVPSAHERDISKVRPYAGGAIDYAEQFGGGRRSPPLEGAHNDRSYGANGGWSAAETGMSVRPDEIACSRPARKRFERPRRGGTPARAGAYTNERSGRFGFASPVNPP